MNAWADADCQGWCVFLISRAVQSARQRHPIQSLLLLLHAAHNGWDLVSPFFRDYVCEHVGFLWNCLVSLLCPSTYTRIQGHTEFFFHKPLLLWTTIPSATSPRLFLHMDRLTEELRAYLNSSCNESLCVQLKSYDSVRDYLKEYVAQPGVKVWIGTEYTNYALYELITPEVCRWIIPLYLVYCLMSFFVSVTLWFNEMYCAHTV